MLSYNLVRMSAVKKAHQMYLNIIIIIINQGNIGFLPGQEMMIVNNFYLPNGTDCTWTEQGNITRALMKTDGRKWYLQAPVSSQWHINTH